MYMRNFPKRGTMTPGEAAKVRGEPGPAPSLMFGRYGFAPLHPFATRKDAPALRRKYFLPTGIRGAILWRGAHCTRPNPEK